MRAGCLKGFKKGASKKGASEKGFLRNVCISFASGLQNDFSKTRRDLRKERREGGIRAGVEKKQMNDNLTHLLLATDYAVLVLLLCDLYRLTGYQPPRHSTPFQYTGR